jgi:C1A family cysteine protease/putative hemolysin
MRASAKGHVYGAACILIFTMLLGALQASADLQEAALDLSDGARPAIGAANPAAVYCAELGYEYVIEDTPGGQRGVVVLPNGERCDAWDFYRGKCGSEFSYCARQGYATETRLITNGSFTAECAVCMSSDGEEIGTVSELMGLEAKVVRALYQPADTEEGGSAPEGLRPAPDEPMPPSGLRAPGRDLPTSFDWRDLDGCSSIKNQGNCGSCWAFGTAAALECNILIKDAVEEDLSEQWLVSCNQEGYGCGGGWWVHDYFQYSTDPCGDAGAVLEADFPYTATNAPCNCPYPHFYFIDGWGFVTGWEVPPVDMIKQAILDYGPVSVAVIVNNAFHDYTGGVFDDCTTGDCNHAVALVGWDDTQGSNGVWFLRNSWGPGWGEDGYMKIEYNCSLVGYASVWVHYRDPIHVFLPNGVPEAIPAGEPTALTVQIEELTDTYVPGSGMLYYRYDGGSFQSVPLTAMGRSLYSATLPSPQCGDNPEFYLSAEGERYGTVYDPPDAPASVHTAFVGILTTVMADDFEADLGWIVEDSPGLADGTWERGIPAGGGDRGDPETDYDGSGRCYVTDNEDGNSDVDDGYTWLTSPAVDVSTADDAIAHYALWYTNNFGNDPNNDLFEVYVSDDGGGTWVSAETIGPDTPMPVVWHEHSFRIGDFVDLTDQVKLRFEASDLDDGSVVEAGIDDFAIKFLNCENTGVGDVVSVPSTRVLHANAPNPFNPVTTIRYELPAPEVVSLAIYDISGRLVRRLVDAERRSEGPHTASWDGRDEAGQRVAAGVYFYRLEGEEKTLTRKMILVK